MEDQNVKPYTWADLKAFCNGLTDEQLAAEIYVVRPDEESIKVTEAFERSEDEYYFDDLEAVCTEKDFDADWFDVEPPYKNLAEALEKEEYTLLPAGRVFLFADL